MAVILGFLNQNLYETLVSFIIMSEAMCMVCNEKGFEIEIQEDSEEIQELKKGLDCYGPIQQQFKLTLEDVADISAVSKD